MVVPKLVEDTKRLHRIVNLRKYAPIPVVYEEEALHSWTFTRPALF